MASARAPLGTSLRRQRLDQPMLASRSIHKHIMSTTLIVKLNKTEAPLRWLHLTDLHVGKDNEAQKTALRSLVAAVERFSGGLQFDVVFMTGDLAYSGQSQEYESLDETLVKPLRETSVCKDAVFIATPGNHDLDCEIGFPPSWNGLGEKRQEKFFNFDEHGQRIRESRAKALTNYSEYITKSNILSVDPLVEPARGIVLEVAGRSYLVISTVSTFFSDKDVSDSQKAPAPTYPVRHLLQNETGQYTKIVLAHHPLNWFTQETERQLHALLLEQDVLYLNGHEHKVTTRFGGKGLTCLGFGAAYQATQDSRPKSYYRNSFAICELTDELHIHVVSWDAENGRWISDLNLPAEFSDRSSRLPDGYRLPMPTTRLTSMAGKAYSNIASSIRLEFRVDSCIWLGGEDAARWTELLLTLGQFQEIKETYALPTQTMASGHREFRVKDRRGVFFVHVVPGFGDILNYEQLKSINTELDKQAYDGCIVATLGILSDEARTLAVQLQSRKRIVVLEGEQITKAIIQATPILHRLLNRLTPSNELATLLIREKGLAIVVEERSASEWFRVLDESGAVIAESDGLVIRVRNEIPRLSGARYSSAEAGAQELAFESEIVSSFNRALYLERSYSYFDDVKYAPLAALGFRFRRASLSEIYVTASADVNGSSAASQNVSRAISEYMDSLSLPRAQRDQLESQIRSRLGIDTGSEVGAARQLYQRYNSIVVLGDPGSGKTCFVKNEILAYCKPPVDQGSWYQRHLPIYISLAEAARIRGDDNDLLNVCSVISARRGIDLPRREISNALSEGRAAFFFDGLDEVGYIDIRISLMAQIGDLVTRYAERGNRFVLATRPAALSPVDIPDGLTYLQLKGLAEEDMRILAGRVMTVRLGADEPQELSSDESALIEQLLDDTRNSPGIARIAKNPLLLTLLVLIYANAGAVGARRHVIYTQAIKTLVSVRGRQTREQQISEADLRFRLGAIANAIFQRTIAEIPRRSEVNGILSQVLFGALPQVESPQKHQLDAFLQEVAEATGLLSIHPENDNNDDDLITFMHYSFLEYYAAVGLLAKDYLQALNGIADNPRWKDVVTLLCGILSEQGDVTPALRAIVEQPSGSETVTNSRLLLALDCAAECDVPPEAAQHALFQALFVSISTGAGRYSGELRDSLAARLTAFLQGTGRILEDYLCRGLTASDPLQVAAFVDLVARLDDAVELSTRVVEGCQAATVHNNQVTRSAILFAIQKRTELRGEVFRACVKTGLRGSLAEKHGAIEAITVVPSFYLDCSENLLALLDDPSSLIASSAARCILMSAFGTPTWDRNPAREEKILARLTSNDAESKLDLPGISLDAMQIERMVLSGSSTEIELAIRYCPILRGEPSVIYGILSRTLKNSAVPRIRSACLDSLRVSPRALDLVTIADTDVICQCARASERNVRIAALRLLGDMPDDEQVVNALMSFVENAKSAGFGDEEVNAAARGVAKHARRSSRLRKELLDSIFGRLPNSPESGFGGPDQQRHFLGLLTICEELGAPNQPGLAMRLLSFSESFRTPLPLRRQSLRAYGAVAPRTADGVLSLVSLLKRNSPDLNDATYAGALKFVEEFKKRVQSVRQVYSALPDLLGALEACWRREVDGNMSIDPAGARSIRDAVVGIREVVSQYDEFASRASLTQRDGAD